MARILILQHEENCGPGRFGRRWAEAGAELVVVHGPNQTIPASLEGFDALVVLGGSMSCTSDDSHPWLVPVKARIREAVEGGVPLLGLCLGHQLIAVATGGEVGPGQQVTLGLTPLLRTEAGRRDPVLGGLAEPVVALHYNYDRVVTLPQGAVVLGHAPDGQVSAVRYGERAWGTQFHPECDAAGFEAWTTAKPEAERPQSAAPLEVVAGAVAAAEPAMDRAWLSVADSFLAQVG